MTLPPRKLRSSKTVNVGHGTPFEGNLTKITFPSSNVEMMVIQKVNLARLLMLSE